MSEVLPDSVTDKIAAILNQVYQDFTHHKKLLKRYKKIHCILHKAQLLLNTTALACGSSTAVTLISGLIPGAIFLSSTASISAGLGILTSLFDRNVLKKIQKHHQLIVLARTLDLKIFENYLYDHQISDEEFPKVMKLIYNYYESQDLIMSKSIVVGGNLATLTKEFQIHTLNGNNKTNGGNKTIAENSGK